MVAGSNGCDVPGGTGSAGRPFGVDTRMASTRRRFGTGGVDPGRP